MSAGTRIRTATATVSATAATTTYSAQTSIDMRRGKTEKIRYVPKRTVSIPSDTEGSYTGMPMTNEQFSQGDPHPTQDADDL